MGEDGTSTDRVHCGCGYETSLSLNLRFGNEGDEGKCYGQKEEGPNVLVHTEGKNIRENSRIGP